MTQDAKLIALLEWMGWEKVHVYEDSAGPAILCGNPPISEADALAMSPDEFKRAKWSRPVPPLTLNLMAEAEAKLTDEQRDDYYYTHLHKKDEDHSWTVSASKEDRLDALLKTLGNSMTERLCYGCGQPITEHQSFSVGKRGYHHAKGECVKKSKPAKAPKSPKPSSPETD